MTPLIDVVFLLLVFFMLASRFAVETRIDLAAGGRGEQAYKGPPRLVSIEDKGLTLNGAPIALDDLPASLDKLVTQRSQIVVLRAGKSADVQRMVAVLDTLKAAGFDRLAIIE